MPDFWLFLAVGFLAQLVDGALGMAYGVVSASCLVSLGVPPANVSASVHASKVFTGAASALSHRMHGNVSKRLLIPLILGGVVGGVVGAYVLTGLPAAVVRPFVVAWLGLMGLFILYRAWRSSPPRTANWRAPAPLGFAGGFLDAIGGGGWGPTVTSSLLAFGVPPRQAVGTSNTAEFFVAVAVSTAFITALLTGHWRDAAGLADHVWAVGGLIVGGVAAAPLAGWITRILPARHLTWAVGLLVLCLCAYQGWKLFTGAGA
ncbi:sulfite exporter TauE/SafE family protein [Brevundimonas sp. 2R-24]|uniref:Probable membrane transporter protein n=1 Tax=Peiella sedimenti TaxID=3061083 RepID=A0ABT8SH40_9CAUL|nr:sulfite exporter TauE/SafE family protein [Caulobacteraceae bacterium XZ-24]